MTGTLRPTDSSLPLGPTEPSDTLGRPVAATCLMASTSAAAGNGLPVRDGGIHEFPAGHVVQTDVQAIVTGEVACVRMEGGEIVRLEGSRPREHEQMRAQQAEVVVDGGGGRLRALADGLAHERLFVFGGTQHEEAAESQQRQTTARINPTIRLGMDQDESSQPLNHRGRGSRTAEPVPTPSAPPMSRVLTARLPDGNCRAQG